MLPSMIRRRKGLCSRQQSLQGTPHRGDYFLTGGKGVVARTNPMNINTAPSSSLM